MLQYDADPTEKEEHGQIILFSHDPDSIYWRASTFLLQHAVDHHARAQETPNQTQQTPVANLTAHATH